MSFFVVLHGPLGSGKTTHAEKLAQVFEAKQVVMDDVLTENNLDRDPDKAVVPTERYIKALDIVMPELIKVLQNGQIVIIDGCFFHRDEFDHLIKSLPFPHYIFTLKASIDVCIERDKLRKKTLGEDAARAVYKLVSDNDFGILVDANNNFEETNKTIMSHLPNIK